MHPYDLIFFGLSLDLCGAIALAKGFMLKNPRDVYLESQMMAGGNIYMLKSSLIQQAEAWVGAVLLAFGYFFQMWANLHGGIAASEPGWINTSARMLAVLLPTSLASYLILRLSIYFQTRRFYTLLVNFLGPGSSNLVPQPGDPDWHDRFARLLDVQRRRSESDNELLARLQRRYDRISR